MKNKNIDIEDDNYDIGKWEYRVCTKIEKTSTSDERLFGIHEVYYNADNTILVYYIEEPSRIFAESFEGLKTVLGWYEKAISKPIIDLDNFPNEYTGSLDEYFKVTDKELIKKIDKIIKDYVHD